MESFRRVPIERAKGLTRGTFDQNYLHGLGSPVVLTDVIGSWPALQRWNFDWFRAKYGSDSVAPRIRSGPQCIKFMQLSDYISYLDDPDKPTPGLWVDADTLYPRQPPADASKHSLYLAWNVFGIHPELLEDVELSPAFMEDWVPLLPTAFRKTLDEATRYFLAGLMVGGKDSQVGLHYDFLDTHAYLAQVVGRKRCTLFSPEDTAVLYDGNVNVDAPDFEKFPSFRNATAYECTLEPGELLFIPYRWWHHVVGLEKSITVNYNFFNRVNFGAFLAQLFRDLPAVVEGLSTSPVFRKALGIKWTCRGFDLPGAPKD
jgi:hypothetical protein